MTEPGNSTEPRTPTSNVRTLVEEVVKMIVDHPEEVAVEEAAGERGGASLNLRVAQTDVGKVIGKQGRTIRSLRNLVSAASIKQNRYYSLEIIEEDGEDNRAARSRSRVAAASQNDDDGDVDGNTEVR
jgi:predicted RNA-binding protein YlqC (UPF0109 family)